MPAAYAVEEQDIVYGAVDGVDLVARLYRPVGDGPFPGVVEVHGGAWTANDRFTNVDIDRPLAESGVVVMAIDFRMPPAVQYPASVQDINLAVRWLKAKATAFSVDPARIGILGTSSGGHQAMLSTLRPADEVYMAHPFEGGGDASVAFAALCWPVVDPLARYRMVTSNGNDRLAAAHHAYWPGEADMEDGNPQRILERGEAGDLPPTLLLQGTADDNLTPDMADRFAAAYNAAGGDLRLEKFEGAPHAFVAKDPSTAHAKRAVAAIIDFVHAQ